MTEPEIVVPDDADENYDSGYDAVEDTGHGDKELGEIPNDAVVDKEVPNAQHVASRRNSYTCKE